MRCRLSICAALFALFGGTALLSAATQDIYLSDSVRLLGFQEVAQKGDPAAVERFSAKAWPDLYAEKNRDHVLVGGVKVFLEDTIDEKKAKLTVTRRDYDKVLVPLALAFATATTGDQAYFDRPGAWR